MYIDDLLIVPFMFFMNMYLESVVVEHGHLTKVEGGLQAQPCISSETLVLKVDVIVNQQKTDSLYLYWCQNVIN